LRIENTNRKRADKQTEAEIDKNNVQIFIKGYRGTMQWVNAREDW